MKVTDTVPANFDFASIDNGGCAGGSIDRTSGVVTCPQASLDSGSAVSFTISARAKSAGAANDTASAASDTSDPDNTNNSGNASVNIVIPAAPGIAPASVDLGNVKLGATATQVETVTNRAATNLIISGVTCGAGIPGCTISSDTCSGKTVAPSGTCGYTISAVCSVVGDFSGNVTETDNSGGSPESVAVKGSCIPAIPPDFTITVSPDTAVIKAGDSASLFTFTLTPTGGFNGTITFACTGLPALASCTFAPPTVTANGSPVTSTLTLSTTGGRAALQTPAGNDAQPQLALFSTWSLAMAGMAGLLFAGEWKMRGDRPRKKYAGWASFISLCLWCLVLIAGCGGRGSQPSNSPGREPHYSHRELHDRRRHHQSQRLGNDSRDPVTSGGRNLN